MEAIKFLGLLSLTWLFTEGAGPVQFIKKLLEVHNLSEPRSLVKKVLRELVNCALCSGFWIGLIFYWFYPNPLLMASVTSVAAELFARLINHVFSNYLNKL